jgi:hypothetical protein
MKNHCRFGEISHAVVDLLIMIVESLFSRYIPKLIWRLHGSGANYDDGVSL